MGSSQVSTLGDLALPNIKQSDQHFQPHLLLSSLGFEKGGPYVDPFTEGLWFLCDGEVDEKNSKFLIF